MNNKLIKKTFPILNLSCAVCANTAQKTLQQQDGVNFVSVNFATETAQIEFDPSKTNVLKLKTALQTVGYDLDIDESEYAEDNLHASQDEHYQSLKKKVIWAILLSIPLVIIAMTPSIMHLPYINYVMWVLASPVVLYIGKDFFIRGYKQARNKSFNMDTLVSLSVGTAYLYSVFNTIYPQFMLSKGLNPDVYFEASTVVISFVLLGKLLEEKAKGNTSTSIKKLIGLRPKTVTLVLENNDLEEVSITKVKVNDIIYVKPGEKIAVDGIVVDGSSFVDESMITGEPIAAEKTTGCKVFAGTINQKGSFKFRAEKVGNSTLLAQIIQMVRDAQGSKAPIQKLVDKIAGIFVPIVMTVAIVSFAIWLLLGGHNAFTHALLSFITVLVIACPCALGLATPTAIMVGIGKGAENGILIKDAESLEIIEKVNAIILDKTGTITEGKPQVTDILWNVEKTKELKDIIFSMERLSEHPLAEAISTYFANESHFINNLSIKSLTGQGIESSFNDTTYYIGNAHLISQQGIKFDNETQIWIDEKLNRANTVVFVGNSEQLICSIAITDRIKQTSGNAIREINRLGIEVYMLTGDNEQTARSIAHQAGINHYRAEQLPADKTNFIKQLQTEGKIVAMVGDGINDSAALAQSDVGIAMGHGSDIAIDTAKMTIISGDLEKIAKAIKLSKETNRTIQQNLFWAFIYNIISIPVAAGMLYPVCGFLLNPMIAGAAMALSSISVVSNSLFLKGKKL